MAALLRHRHRHRVPGVGRERSDRLPVAGPGPAARRTLQRKRLDRGDRAAAGDPDVEGDGLARGRRRRGDERAASPAAPPTATASACVPANLCAVGLETPVRGAPLTVQDCVPLSKLYWAAPWIHRCRCCRPCRCCHPCRRCHRSRCCRVTSVTPPAFRIAPARLFMNSCPSVYVSFWYELWPPAPAPNSSAITPVSANLARCAVPSAKKYSGRLSL